MTKPSLSLGSGAPLLWVVRCVTEAKLCAGAIPTWPFLVCHGIADLLAAVAILLTLLWVERQAVKAALSEGQVSMLGILGWQATSMWGGVARLLDEWGGLPQTADWRL